MPGPKPKLGNLVLNLNVNCHEDGICIWVWFLPIYSGHKSALNVTMYFFPNHYRLLVKTSIVIKEQVIIYSVVEYISLCHEDPRR